MCEPRVGPSLYSFTPGLTHMLLAASSCAGFPPLGNQYFGSGYVSEGSTPWPPLSCLVSVAQQGLNNDMPYWIEFKLSTLPSPLGLPNGLFPIPTGSPPGLVEQYPGLFLILHSIDGYLQLVPTPVPAFLSSCLPRAPAWDMNSFLAWGSAPLKGLRPSCQGPHLQKAHLDDVFIVRLAFHQGGDI